jgi:hypothetical protein
MWRIVTLSVATCKQEHSDPLAKAFFDPDYLQIRGYLDPDYLLSRPTLSANSLQTEVSTQIICK